MKKFLKDKLSIDLEQKSTQKGIALVGAGIALATGHPEVLTISLTETGIQYGGIIGATLPTLMGVWEIFRKEKV